MNTITPDSSSRTVLVCGGRDYVNYDRVCLELEAIHANTPIGLLVHGDAPGADASAAYWAAENKVPTRAFPAQWSVYGRAAGPRRNLEMARFVSGQPNPILVAFPGGRGTEHMINTIRNDFPDIPTHIVGA